MISIENVYFKYEKNYILENINLKINKGDFLAILGHNGAGKTTLIKLILGLIKPEKGTIKIENNKIGYMKQGFSGIEQRFPATVFEVASMGLMANRGILYRMKENEKKMIEEALKITNLYNLKDKNINELSGGQQQKAYLARALAKNPEILILDEPTNNLDVKSQNEFYKTLEKLNKKGLTIVIVTHDVGLIMEKANRIAVLNKTIIFDSKKEKIDIKKIWKILGGI